MAASLDPSGTAGRVRRLTAWDWRTVAIIGRRNSPAASKQRTVIARAIVSDPAMILVDEPTGALDSRTSSDVLAIFEELHQDGRTIVMVTHDLDVARRAERRITIHDGRIVEDDRASNRKSYLRIAMSGAGQ
jgi:putative ABC transport system ATP-binding protein